MANLSVNTYSPGDVVLSFGGYKVVGWDQISTNRTSNVFLQQKGIRGKHTRVPSQDTSALITVSLIQTSPSNDVFSEVLSQDELNGTGRLEVILKDQSGRSIFQSNEAYIVGFPETKYSGGFEYRVWSIMCQRTSTYTVGGNTRPETSLVDSILGGIAGVAGNIF